MKENEVKGYRPTKKVVTSYKKFPPVVYGLKGICAIFNISMGTALKYRHTIIKDTCTQNGRVIIVDTRKAFELFGCVEPVNFVSNK
jgi:hypothetical protein